MMKFPWKLFMLSVVISGCTGMCSSSSRKTLTPEQVVESYLDVALNMKNVDERNNLLQYTTGNLKSVLESATEATIKSAYVDRRYNLLNYSVVERRDRTPRETEISFQLTYHDLGSNAQNSVEQAKITTENTVSVVREKGIWYIRDVLGHKTSIDFPVSEESRITAKADSASAKDTEPDAQLQPTDDQPVQEEDPEASEAP